MSDTTLYHVMCYCNEISCPDGTGEPDARGRLVKARWSSRKVSTGARRRDAARAGLTDDLLRHFTDKREVLFSGSKDLEKTLVDMTRTRPKGRTFDVVAEALRRPEQAAGPP
jgi:hypothetical protein